VLRAPVVSAVAVGGALGAAGRYGAGSALGGSAVGTIVVNLSGCLLIGVLTVLVGEVWAGHRLLRPFLGTGVLGGYTTFSGYALDAQRLIVDGRPGAALAYLLGTVAGALLAVQLGIVLARALALRRRST
jgi:CrcB protein